MTPRWRRFLLLLGGFAAYAAFTVLTPMKIWAGTMLVVSLAVFVWLCWHLAKEPFPWSLPWWRR
jgi:hypothetical protein